jgi:hypothetical protein
VTPSGGDHPSRRRDQTSAYSIGLFMGLFAGVGVMFCVTRLLGNVALFAFAASAGVSLLGLLALDKRTKSRSNFFVGALFGFFFAPLAMLVVGVFFWLVTVTGRF